MLKGRFVTTTYTLKQRITIYYRRLKSALFCGIPKSYERYETVEPGEDGYDECILEYSFSEPWHSSAPTIDK